MKQVWITKYGAPEVLQVREADDPVPGPGEIRIRVAAAGINFADVSARVGLYPDAPKPPCVVGYEVAGTIDAVGDGVDDPNLSVGQRVASLTRFGGYSTCVCVPANQAMPIVDEMPFDDAAALLVNYLTAGLCLFETGPVHPGARVLLHMAAGGVGLAVIQLLSTIDDVEIFGTASASKHDILREMGVAHPIDYHTVDYADVVREKTGGTGVDIVLDPLGGADWKKGLGLLRPMGRLVAFGFANAVKGTKRNMFKVIGQFLKIPKANPLKLMDANNGIFGLNLGHLWDEVTLLRRHTDRLMQLYAEGAIKPRVKTFAFEDAAAAHQYIHDRKNIGKVVLVVEESA